MGGVYFSGTLESTEEVWILRHWGRGKLLVRCESVMYLLDV